MPTRPLTACSRVASPCFEQGSGRSVKGLNGGLIVPEMLCRLGEDYRESSRTADARRMLVEAGDLMERNGEVYWEPELFRLRGRFAAAEGRGAPAAGWGCRGPSGLRVENVRHDSGPPCHRCSAPWRSRGPGSDSAPRRR